MNDCLFGCDGAVGIFFLPRGCVGFRNVQTQVLCWQHAGSARDGSLAGIELVQGGLTLRSGYKEDDDDDASEFR